MLSPWLIAASAINQTYTDPCTDLDLRYPRSKSPHLEITPSIHTRAHRAHRTRAPRPPSPSSPLRQTTQQSTSPRPPLLQPTLTHLPRSKNATATTSKTPSKPSGTASPASVKSTAPPSRSNSPRPTSRTPRRASWPGWNRSGNRQRRWSCWARGCTSSTWKPSSASRVSVSGGPRTR